VPARRRVRARSRQVGGGFLNQKRHQSTSIVKNNLAASLSHPAVYSVRSYISPNRGVAGSVGVGPSPHFDPDPDLIVACRLDLDVGFAEDDEEVATGGGLANFDAHSAEFDLLPCSVLRRRSVRRATARGK
jgi:hypothetical protein